MIPAPTIHDLLVMFGRDPQPLRRDKIKANLKDPELADVYIRALVSEGLIIECFSDLESFGCNGSTFKMTSLGHQKALDEVRGRIRVLQEQLTYLESLTT